MKTPYDIEEAKRWFEAAEKQARSAIRKLALGDESQQRKAIRERDKMSSLLRWFYSDDRAYWEKADKATDDVASLYREAIDLGYTARQEARAAEMSSLREKEREREASLSPGLRQYKKELRITADDILRGAGVKKR